jgi:hypothetical protein
MDLFLNKANDTFALFSSLPTPVWVKFRHKLNSVVVERILYVLAWSVMR